MTSTFLDRDTALDTIGAPEPALFLDVTAPVPFACAEGFWIAVLIDELKYYHSPLMIQKKNTDETIRVTQDS